MGEVISGVAMCGVSSVRDRICCPAPWPLVVVSACQAAARVVVRTFSGYPIDRAGLRQVNPCGNKPFAQKAR